MHNLRTVDVGDASTLLIFERENRSYFSQFVTDRGDEYFDHFTEGFDVLLAEHHAGTTLLHVLVDEDDVVLGRFNLYDVHGASAVLGYRMAQRAAGRGLATEAVRELCARALADYGLDTLWATTSHENVASKRVLMKAGFEEEGPARPGGRPGSWYRRDLVDDAHGARHDSR